MISLCFVDSASIFKYWLTVTQKRFYIMSPIDGSSWDAMFHVTPSTRYNLPNSEIISVDQIWQGCILQQFANIMRSCEFFE
jgi:hypothetical protein